MARLATGWIAVLLGAGAGGCSSAPAAASADEDAERPGVADVRAPGPIATPEWETEVTRWTGYPIQPIAFRAGGGLVSLLQGPRLANWMFVVADSGRAPAGGPIPSSFDISGNPPLGAASDIAAVSTDGRSWFLDPRTGRIVSEDVGHYRALVASLGTGGTIRTACALGARAVAYLDVTRPDTVFVRDLTSPAPTRALARPAHLAVMQSVPWDSLRFGGSPDGPCVLSNPRLDGLLVVSDSAVRVIDGFVEPPVPVATSRPEPWYAPLARLISGDETSNANASPTQNVLQATSFPGGVALLFAGRTPHTGRVVDFYSHAGDYLASLYLPHLALGVAAGHGRLYVVRQQLDPEHDDGGRVFLASYRLPSLIREEVPATAAPTVVAPRAPGLRAVEPSDTTGR